MFLASREQIQLIILELSDLVTKHKVSALHSRLYAKVGQPKSNNQKVMCVLSFLTCLITITLIHLRE